MFAAGSMPIERPADWRSTSHHNTSQSAYNSPAGSRRSSVSSVASAQTDPGLFSDRSRQSSATSNASVTTTKSGFKSLFSKKDKKSKEKKDVEKVVLTSKHAALVKTRMMMDARYQNYKDKKPVKTAGIVSSVHTGHLSAAQQEARHPHSGPPTLHPQSDMPLLTRIASGDECDDEEEFDKLEKARLDWDLAKTPGFANIREHEGDESAQTSAEQSADEDNVTPPARDSALSPNIEKVLLGTEPRRPTLVAKNSYGGRFRKDEHGHWKR